MSKRHRFNFVAGPRRAAKEALRLKRQEAVNAPMTPLERRQLEEFWRANPERRPSPVRVLSRDEISKLYPEKP